MSAYYIRSVEASGFATALLFINLKQWILHISLRASWYNSYSLDQQNAHTLMFYFTKLVYARLGFDLTGPSSGSAVVRNNR